MSYEDLRTQLRRVVADALPTDPDDGTVVVRYDGPGDVPIWGPPGEVAEAITSAVLGVLYPDPVEPELPPAPGTELYTIGEMTGYPADKWPCGCSTRGCKLQWDVFTTAGTDPTATTRVTCITHSLRGTSMPTVANGDGGRRQAQALYQLGIAHQQDCH